jgi:hypothetical protein
VGGGGAVGHVLILQNHHSHARPPARPPTRVPTAPTPQVGGQWLAVWIVIAAGFSQVGQYQAEMASDSYQVLGMAERGFLPKALGKRSKHDTPTWGA